MEDNRFLVQNLRDDVYKQWNKFPRHTLLQIVERFFSEKHLIAVQFGNFHYQVRNGGLVLWEHNGYMKDDYENLFEYVERGYAQRIKHFDTLLTILESLRDLGEPTSFKETEQEEVKCAECDGVGYYWDSNEACSECGGEGVVFEDFVLYGEEAYNNKLNSLSSLYSNINEAELLKSFDMFIDKLDEEDLDIKNALIRREKENRKKPKCKLIGENSNIFNLAVIAKRTLIRNNMREDAEEMVKNVTASHSFDEALAIITDYVDAY